MAKISHIAKNMKIKKIGTLFKKHNSGSWAINLALENESKNTESTYTNFSNAKLLRKNSHINPTQEYPKVQLKIGYLLSIIQTFRKASL